MHENSDSLRPIRTILLLFVLITACQQRSRPTQAPWGDTIRVEGEAAIGEHFDLDDIKHSGELIALTISGPDTYYDYQGRALGVHALLCQQLADSLGVRLRIEVCRDTVELLNRLRQGDADLVAYPLSAPDSLWPGWQVAADKPLLREALTTWYSADKLAQTAEEERRLLSAVRVKRRVFEPMLNKSGGIISRYDALFQQYCKPIHWDWRLMAAQCYQESTFDPNALSWAGARGLMQIMPATADHLGLPHEHLTDPEQNIAAAARYIEELNHAFSDVGNKRERQDFVLAAYNGGAHHIRDAMALAARDGRNQYSWREVADYVLLLSKPSYYQDPIVKNGYMRGSETVDYVRLIRQRYQQYRGIHGSSPGTSSPRKSLNERHRKKFSV